jgi:UDP-2,3-diacylglucosamine pyrophosphatase LpxH/glycosyltransferase involved in cell wall biosynthesis
LSMRIDFVTDTFPPDINGVAMTLGRLAEGVRKRRHLVHVIRSGDPCGQRGQSGARSLVLPGYKEVRVGLPGPVKLRRRWSRKRPDAVYVATESPLGSSAIKAASSLGIPVAAGFHTNFHEYVEQYQLAGLQTAAMAYLKRVHRRADVTLAPSKEVVEMLRAEGFGDVRLLGRGVDTELFTPERRNEGLRGSWGARPGSLVAMIVGRVAPEKNMALAMRAFGRMRELMPDVKCVVVGDGPIRARLQQENPWIHYAGMQHGEDLAEHYASADVLIFPSETETFGNVVLEGMASGLAVVGYDYAAAAQHVEHGRNGLKAPKGDDEAFIAEAMAALRPRAQKDIRGEARSSVEDLGWGRVIDTFEGLLGEIADKGRTPVEGSVWSSRKRKRSGMLDVRSVFISDVHLGTADSKVREVTDFLKHVRCEKLVLNGDIIDGWALRRGARWRNRHTKFVRCVLKKTEKEGTKVIYVRGNHDEILERFMALQIGSIEIAKQHIHETPDGRRYLVVHGDGFDSVSTGHKWLAWLGALGYDTLLVINRWYNRWRAWRGKEYFSLSKRVKAKVKSAVSFIDRYEEQLQELARKLKCEGIICGHIHTPEDKQVGGVHYLNSGDWVESLSAVIEHHDGSFELVSYNQFLERLAETGRKGAAKKERQGAARPPVAAAGVMPGSRAEVAAGHP